MVTEGFVVRLPGGVVLILINGRSSMPAEGHSAGASCGDIRAYYSWESSHYFEAVCPASCIITFDNAVPQAANAFQPARARLFFQAGKPPQPSEFWVTHPLL
jgi:hypothetical protein